jgi:penicillin-binding protein 1C
LHDERRLIPIYQELFQEKNQMIAFKTGTSHGLRDAWCVGYTKNYTVGIWMGSPPGGGDERLVGMESAAPVMLKIIRDIWNDAETAFEMPEDVYSRKVCALSGALPTNNCPHTVTDIAIRRVSSMKLCTLHKNIDGDVFIDWPRELKNWMQVREQRQIPAHLVRITSPASNRTIILQNGQGTTERIFLSAEGDPPHYWYLDGKYIGKSQNGDGMFADVGHGHHKLSVLSGEASDLISFEVKTPAEIQGAQNKGYLNVLN